MAQIESTSKNDDSVELQINHGRDESEVEANTRRAEALFEARELGGCCCKNMWKWYFCPGSYDDISGCCDVDHLASHFFILSIAALIYLFFYTYSRDKQSSTTVIQPSFEISYLLGMGGSIIMLIWGLWQITFKLFNGRMAAARILDANNKLRAERANLDNNIIQVMNVQQRLLQTQKRKSDATTQLKVLFNNLNQRTNEIEIISDKNANIGALLKDKYVNLLEKLKNELIASEKLVIETIYNNLHLKDNIVGLDQDEFKEFVNKLPTNYKKRFKFEVGNFDKYAGVDGIFDRKELFTFLDKFIDDELITKPIS